MKYKILLLTTILFLIMGTVTAFEINELKTMDDYTDWDSNGYSNYTTNSNRYFLAEKISTFDDDFKDEWFNNHPEWDYSAKLVEDNIYYTQEDNFFYGYSEVVEIDGNHYMISINQNSKLSPGEEKLYLEDLKEFNKINNLEPVEI